MFRPKKGRLSAQEAQELAIAALIHLSQDEDRLNAFLTNTGLSVDDLRGAAGQPQFFSALLDHVTSDDALVLGLATEANVAPEDISAAAQYFHKDEF